jgi:hypothetical protein
MDKLLAEQINKSLKEFVSKEWDKHIEALNREKDVWIAGMVLNITKHMDIQNFGEKIIITLKKDVQK